MQQKMSNKLERFMCNNISYISYILQTGPDPLFGISVEIVFKLNLIISEESLVVLRMISDDFTCSDVLSCFPMFSAGLQLLSITAPCADIFAQDDVRCFQMISAVYKCSQDALN